MHPDRVKKTIKIDSPRPDMISLLFMVNVNTFS